LHIVESGTTVLSGANTYSGGTTVAQDSILQVTTSSLPASVTLQGDGPSPATLGFLQGFDGAYGNSVTGNGGYVAKYGAGTVSFSGTISAAAPHFVSLAMQEGGFKLTGANNVFSNVVLVVQGGVFDLNNTNQTVIALSGSGGAVALGTGTLTFGDSMSRNIGITISGTGGITKVGTGLVDFYTGSYTYTGATRVNAGTFLMETSIAANGSDKVYVNAAADFSSASINRRVAGALAGYGSTASGNAAGLLGTSADIRAGQYTSNNIHTGFVNMQWRERTATETGVGHGGLISDVMNLEGIQTSSSSGDHLQSSPYALEMSYSTARLGVSEAGSATNGLIYLAWLNTGAGLPLGWQNATNGDFGSGTVGNVFTNVQSSWDSFAAAHQVTDTNLGNFLGSYGVDIANHRAWAVINYDASYFNTSQFAVIPEPSSLCLGLIGLTACGIAARRARKR
jgi:autotransporter-associated beta strand protein